MSILRNVVFTTCMLTQVNKMIDSYALTFPITQCVPIHDNPHVVVTIHVAVQGVKVKYRIAGKFGGELNLAVWRYALKPPN